jgi:serine/threonine protein kinase
MARFKHPAIIRVVRFFTANQTGYIVMEFEEGRSLADLLKNKDRTMTEADLRALFIPVMEGLAEVHRQDILHRDIKPGNIYIRTNGSPVLLDFGAAGGVTAHLDDEQDTMCTPGYAAYELQHGDLAHQGPWTDIYSLGATIYRIVVGKKPVDASTRMEACKQGRSDPMPQIRDFVDTNRFSPSFLNAMDHMLQVDYLQRPKSIRQILDLLAEQPGGRAGLPASVAITPPPPSRIHRHLLGDRKLVFAGSTGSGTTTAVATLSDVSVIDTQGALAVTERRAHANPQKSMDYGTMDFGQNEILHLYGAPDLDRLAFVREMLRKGTIGLVLIVDNSRPDPLKDLDTLMETFEDFTDMTQICIGVSHTDVAPIPLLDDYQVHLTNRGCKLLPILEIDPRERQDMVRLVEALLYSIDPGAMVQ